MPSTEKNGKSRPLEKARGDPRKSRHHGAPGQTETVMCEAGVQTTKPARLWLPLTALEEGAIYGRSRLQKMAFLAQHGSGLELYEFADDAYGPYSEELERDFTGAPEMIAERTEMDEASGEYHCRYSLTEPGRKRLSELEGGMDPGTLKAAKGAIYGKMSTKDMLEAVYSKFVPELDESVEHKDEILEEVRKITSPVTAILDEFHTREAILVLAWMEGIEKVMDRLDRAKRPVQRIVIFNMSMSMIRRCGSITDKLVPPIDSHTVKPILRDIDELERQLLEYCDVEGIMRDPYTIPMSEIISVGDSKRLAKELSKISIETLQA